MDNINNNINNSINNANQNANQDISHDGDISPVSYSTFFAFPRTVAVDQWEKYLNRPLDQKEKYLLLSVISEHRMNEKIRELYNRISQRGKLYIPALTNMNGNCLFESLIYHRIGDTVDQLRKVVATLFYIFKNYKNFIPSIEVLETEFANFNDIEFAICYKKIGDNYNVTYYKYTYDIMCQDLSNSHSWSNLNTQLILLLLSYILKLEIVIYYNYNDYECRINAYEKAEIKPELKTIYLGLIDETHYLPIDMCTDSNHNDDCMIGDEYKFDDTLPDPPAYTIARNKFFEWGKEMEALKIDQYHRERVEVHD